MNSLPRDAAYVAFHVVGGLAFCLAFDLDPFWFSVGGFLFAVADDQAARR